MGVTDASTAKLVVRDDGEAYVTFHIKTTNHSDRKLKITWCGPKHAYITEGSRNHVEEAPIELCTAYPVGARTTKRLTATKRDDVFGYDGGSVKILGKGGVALIETCRITCLWAVESHPVAPRVERPYEG